MSPPREGTCTVSQNVPSGLTVSIAWHHISHHMGLWRSRCAVHAVRGTVYVGLSSNEFLLERRASVKRSRGNRQNGVLLLSGDVNKVLYELFVRLITGFDVFCLWCWAWNIMALSPEEEYWNYQRKRYVTRQGFQVARMQNREHECEIFIARISQGYIAGVYRLIEAHRYTQ